VIVGSGGAVVGVDVGGGLVLGGLVVPGLLGGGLLGGGLLGGGTSDAGGLAFVVLEPPGAGFGLALPALRVVGVRGPMGAPPPAGLPAAGIVLVTASGSMVVEEVDVGRGRVVVVRGTTWVATSNFGDDSPKATSSTRALRATTASP
jgi:hypothetical protein